MFCDQCGSENRNDRKFCSNCGAPLTNYTKVKENLIMPEEIEKKQDVVKNRQHIKKVAKAILWVLFGFALLTTILSFFVDGPLFWVTIGFALAFYLALLITIIVQHKLLKKLK